MAQSKQALRTRIRSVNSTRKITRAMEMIANAKLFKQRKRMETNRTYVQTLQDIVNRIAVENPGADSVYLKTNDSPAVYSVVFCSDLGLCGAYNMNVLRFCAKNLKKEDPMVLIGTSLYTTMKENGWNVINTERISSDRLENSRLKKIVQSGVNMYLDGRVSKVQMVYTQFINTMRFDPAADVLLPFSLKDLEKMEEKPAQEGKLPVETLFEPDAETILSSIIPMMIGNVAYSDWMESTTSEQGSRRAAMKTATDNADDLSDQLLLEYNKARQAAITQEITEIIGGSSAV